MSKQFVHEEFSSYDEAIASAPLLPRKFPKLVERRPPDRAEKILAGYFVYNGQMMRSPMGGQLDYAQAFVGTGPKEYEPWAHMSLHETIMRSTTQYDIGDMQLMALGTGSRMLTWIWRNARPCYEPTMLWYGDHGQSWKHTSAESQNMVLYPLTKIGRKLIKADLKRAKYQPDSGDNAFIRIHMIIGRSQEAPEGDVVSQIRDMRAQARILRIGMYEAVRQAFFTEGRLWL